MVYPTIHSEVMEVEPLLPVDPLLLVPDVPNLLQGGWPALPVEASSEERYKQLDERVREGLKDRQCFLLLV